jgi:tRNA (uracil-5-)-methyltransferase
MDCKHFGECGSCTIYEHDYDGQLEQKQDKVVELFKPYYQGDIEVFESPKERYRARAEFKVWHQKDDIFYAMNRLEKQGRFPITECFMVNQTIATLMEPLLKLIKLLDIKEKLFGIDFLTAKSGKVVVSLIYHQELDEAWLKKALQLSEELRINIIGRSRGQKVIVGNDFVVEDVELEDKTYFFKHVENSFTQPNPYVNKAMINWSRHYARDFEGDLLELYCGAGNFTIPLAQEFNQVLATEVSKSSIKAAHENAIYNSTYNVTFVRLSSEEFVQAYFKERVFFRLKDVDLDTFNLTTLFVDPPRAGLDDETRSFAQEFENIIYISCNPETLARDMKTLEKTHHIRAMALFDQFPYTAHLEMGVILRRN